MIYTTIITEGGLLPADILDAIASEELTGQRPEDFGLERGRNLSDRIAAAWQAARGHWMLFKTYVDDLRESDPGTTVTRQRWVLPLLDMLGYQLAFNTSAYQIEGRSYAISHRAGQDDAPPVHIEGIRTSLDARPPSGRPRLSPHALLQEYLNSTEHLWGIVTNGERLRLLRDSSRFTRPTYVEFDLRAMFEGEKFSEFALLYRLIHRSRLPHDSTDAAGCLLEKYHQQAVETGGRVREKLRDGVELALRTLGSSLLEHPANAELRAKLESGKLTPLAYYRQVLKLIYRLLFLMVAEDRGLIATGTRRLTAADDDPFEITSTQSFDALLASLVRGPSVSDRLRIYYNHYSVARLRRMAEAPGAGRGPYDDLWMGLQTTFRLLEGSDEQSPRSLGLAPLDGDLFGPEAIADLEGQRLRNADLLRAIRALSLYREKESKALRRVNYGALDVEELGSVYESLLDYRPVVTRNDERGTMNGAQPSDSSLIVPHSSFDLVAGTERKTTGSYYTRPELVQELIKSALVPVIEDRLRAARDKETKKQGDKQNLHQHRSLSPGLPVSLSAEEQALLSIKVCDPACGSGHFLLAAARRLGRELAKVRSGEDQPTPTIFRRAVRDVIQHCIYGVDLNPLAVDLCKLALWIEGHNAGMPLNFLDHHIKQGNSLIGATRALIAQGIPDDAYKPVTGDDKKVASEIKKRNKAERERYVLGYDQRSLFDAPTDDGGAALADALRQLDDMAAGSVAEVRAKAARYRQIQSEAEAERTRFNLWTAAFFQPLTPANAPRIPTTATLADFERNPRAVRADVIGAANGLAAEAGFFHWELEFPQVFAEVPANASKSNVMLSEAKHLDAKSPRYDEMLHSVQHDNERRGGFDVVLGNPPWERIKLQEQEHWVDVPEVRDAANKAAREKMIQAWRASADPAKQARVAEFDAAKYRAEAESRFVRASERFPLTAVGDVNTYALFAEHARDLLAPTGRAGIIVPTGIATDDVCKEFFANVNKRKQLISLYDFENRENIFPGVGHGVFKFSLVTIGTNVKQTEFIFFATNVHHLNDQLRRFQLLPDEIALINPNTRTCAVFRTSADAELTKKIYRRVPVLVNEGMKSNSWGVSFLRMFDMSNDSDLFHIIPDTREPNVMLSEAKHLTDTSMNNDEMLHFVQHDSEDNALTLLPLYEAKMFWHFTHRFGDYADYPKGGESTALPTVSSIRLQNPSYQVKSRYLIDTVQVNLRLSTRAWRSGWILAFRDITKVQNERTVVFSLLPRLGVGHTAPLIFLEESNAQQYACFLSIVNSLTFDFVARQKLGGTHLTYTILQQLPVLPPSAFSESDIAFIVPRVLELVYTAWDMQPFAEDVVGEVKSEKEKGNKEAAELFAEILRRNAECNADAPRELFPLPAGLDKEDSSSFIAHRSSFDLPPFRWNDQRRAHIRAELDARIARLYGLTRDELRYILDPSDVYGPDFPGETFRVLKEKETKLYGEYRTRRLVLEAWDREEGKR